MIKLFTATLLFISMVLTSMSVFAQSVSISSDSSDPNSNAMLDVKSPSTGNGKGILIPRITAAQRTTADANLAGGLLDDSGKLRGGTAQGLIVYQTDGTEGLYYNTSTSALPNWIYIGTGSGNGTVTSIIAGTGLDGGTITTSGTISLANTGTAGTYTKVTTDAKGRVTTGTTLTESDIPNLNASKITAGTVTHERGGLEADVSAYSGLVKITGGSTSAVTVTGAGEAILDDADAAAQRTTLGLGTVATQSVPYTLVNGNGTNGQFMQTNGSGTTTWSTVTLPISGTTVSLGDSASVSSNGVAVGYLANGETSGAAVGYTANSASYGVALGYQANGYDSGVAIGRRANSYVGAGSYSGGVAVGYTANAYSGDGKYSGGVAVGYAANARHNFNENDSGAVAVGFKANGFIKGATVGWESSGYNQGVALGYLSSGSNSGVGVGFKANGYSGGTAIGYMANSGNRNYAFAKGAYSQCTRYNEEWKSSDGVNNKFGYGQANFHGSTTTASATEIYLGGSAGQRFVLNDNSAVTFTMLVTGINTVTADSSGWRVWGVIKRRSGANTTAISGVVTIDAKTQGGLNTNPTVTADTTNGALKLQVTGVNANTVIWNTTMTYSEARE